MAVTYIPTKGGQGYVVLCLSSDTKPTSTTPASLIETDTGILYYPNGAGGWTAVSGGGITQLTSDVTAGPGSGSVAATIANDAVTFAKMQNAAANTIIARAANSSGDLSEVALSTDNLAGRASGDITAITLGSGITMSGGALVASAGASGMVQLARTVLGSDTTPVTFSSISGAYNHLKLIITGRDTTSAVIGSVGIRFNNDSGANYDWQVWYGVVATSTATASTAQTSGNIAVLPGATSARAASQGQVEILIPDYAATTFEKTCMATNSCPAANTVGTIYTLLSTNSWRNTAAITRIDFIATTNFKTGSIFTLYGIS